MDGRLVLCDAVPALRGHRIGLTADRRADEQAELLRRMGADVVLGPVIRTLPLGDDRPMREATEALLADPPDLVLLTTGIGVRSWVGAAETWGLADDLVSVLGATQLHARGPKAYAAAAQLGLTVARREPTERFDRMVDAAIAAGIDGRHVAVQRYGNDVPWALDALHAAGARVTEVPIYRWVPPDDEGPARRIVREAVDGQLSAVTFTSPAAVAELCRIADDDGLIDALLSAFASKVAAACVGPVTRAAAEDLGIRVACAPAVGRLGLLVRSLAAELRSQHAHLSVGSRELLVHGGLVAWQDGEVSLPDRERQVLSALVRRPGVVVARTAIQREVWGSADEDGALDAVLSRLRRSLAPTGATITTRVRRGYLLEATALPCPAAA